MIALFLALSFMTPIFAASKTSSTAQKSLAPHTHGVGQIDLAINENQLMLSFDIPAIDLLGFEHKAQSKNELQQLAIAEEKLKHPIPYIFKLTPKNQCLIDGPISLENIIADGHSEFRMEIQFKCQKKLATSKLQFKIFSTFPQLKKLVINILRANGPVEVKHIESNQEIIL